MFETWEELENSIAECKKCKLYNNRRNIVFGEGNKDANIMFIGETAGTDGDESGKPFVDKAGIVFDLALQTLGIKREEIYITNIIKCGFTLNRKIEQNECDACINYLRNQVILIKPKVIVLLGNIPLKNVLGKEYEIAEARGIWVEKRGIKYMPTWNPEDLLKDETKKVDFLKDLQLVIEEM